MLPGTAILTRTALQIEVVMDVGVDECELLQTLSSSERKVRILHAVSIRPNCLVAGVDTLLEHQIPDVPQ
jgi:hypothetical protein